jgi:hypothetical protein
MKRGDCCYFDDDDLEPGELHPPIRLLRRPDGSGVIDVIVHEALMLPDGNVDTDALLALIFHGHVN